MWVGLESAGQSQLSEQEKQILFINTYMWNLKKMWGIYLQGRNREADIEIRHMDIVGETEGGMNWEIRTDIYTLGLPTWRENLPVMQKTWVWSLVRELDPTSCN